MISLTLSRPPLRAWFPRGLSREVGIAIGALGFSAAAVASVAHFGPHRGVLNQSVLPTPLLPTMTVEPISAEQAVRINRSIPLLPAREAAAKPFGLGNANGAAREAALNCLAQAVYYEAGRESDDGQRAVAQVVLNRVRHPAFPASVCGVVYEGATRPTGCQFTFTCDGSLVRRPDAAGWDRARRIAAAALQGSVYRPVGNATHYHADYVVPVWAASLAKTDVVGTHLFYRWAGGWGRPDAFVQQYSGREVAADLLRKAALAARATYIADGTPTATHTALALTPAPRANGLLVTEQGNGRVRVHFTPQARAAVETAIARPAPAGLEPPSAAVLDAGAPALDQRALGA